MNDKQAIIAIALMSITTVIIRALPFLLFANTDKKPPAAVEYLGKYLPYANIVLLIFYCLRHVNIANLSSILPAVVGIGITGILQLFFGKQILSVVLGTGAYVILLNIM